MSGSQSQWLLTTVNAVRELMIGRLERASLDAEARRDVQMALEELDVMWEELQGQAEALAREHQRYAEFFQHAPDAYVVTDAGGNIREANRAAAELLGSAPEALARRPLSGFLAEEDRVGFFSRFVGALAQDGTSSWEAHLLLPSRGRLAALLSVRSIPLGHSGVGGLCWLIRPLA